jgi:hypothetical protein
VKSYVEESTIKFAHKVLSPGSLVVISHENQPYIFPTISLAKQRKTSVSGSALSRFHNDEPCIIVSTIVDSTAVFIYMIGQVAVGWLHTWETDGVVEQIVSD